MINRASVRFREAWRQFGDMRKKALDRKVFYPGAICLLLVVIFGAVFPTQMEYALNESLAWIMDHFKWLYVLCVMAIVGLFLWILFGPCGSIRFGGKNAKPSLKTSTWCTLSLTGTIAVGICFYGVSGPVNLFMNPPAFLGVEAGTREAIIPTLKYCFLHYGLPSYFIILTAALAIALVYYNGNRALRGNSALYPLIGERSEGFIGTLVNIVMVVSLIVCGTNMGLAVIQLNSGIGTVAGMTEVPKYETIIIIIYTVGTVIFATSGVHKLMGKLSNFNAFCYAVILLFVLLVGNTNRILNLLFTAVGEYVVDFIPMVSFGDPIYETGWQSTWSMFYYSWNIVVPGLMQAFFYVSICYGRTLRQFVFVNCILPCAVVFTWYAAFGGSAMLGIVEGSNLWEVMQQYGDGIATFAFLDTLPFAAITKWGFIVVAMITFITFSDSIAYSFPMMFMKDTAEDASLTKTPKVLNAAVALFMGALTAVLLFVGGYNALNAVITVFAFPSVILTLLMVISAIKMLLNRKKYDITYYEKEVEEVPEPVVAQ
ncbi:MAG: BCCT family transporter [Planctomycetes bacterium]|nr:BCCT family transporter [Planctomycetota bacterium]